MVNFCSFKMPVFHGDLWALLGGIVHRKARFICSLLDIEGVPVSCFQTLLLKGSFEQGSRDNLFPVSMI